jgi:hypothetical protein
VGPAGGSADEVDVGLGMGSLVELGRDRTGVEVVDDAVAGRLGGELVLGAGVGVRVGVGTVEVRGTEVVGAGFWGG